MNTKKHSPFQKVFHITTIVAFLFLALGCNIAHEDLNAELSYNNLKARIKNLDAFDWKEVEVAINGEYKLNIKVIPSNTSYDANFVDFTKNDSSRFNPFAIKPKDLRITAYRPDGKFSWAKFNLEK